MGSRQPGDDRSCDRSRFARVVAEVRRRMLGEKIYKELVEFTWKVRSNPEHEVRLAANRFLIDFADDLQNDPETIKKAEGIKAEIMGREEVTGLASSTWQVAKRLIMESVDDPNSTLRTKVAENVAGFGVRLRDDESMREKVDGWLVQGTKYIAENYTDEITGVISDTVERWDATRRARRSSCRSVEIFSSSVSTHRCRLDRRAADLHDFDAHLRLSCPVCDVHHEC